MLRLPYMLVDKNDANILTLLCELVKGGLDGGGVCLAVDDEEVLLGVGSSRYVLQIVSELHHGSIHNI